MTRTTSRARTAIPLAALVVAVVGSAVNAVIAAAGTALGATTTGAFQPIAFITLTTIGAVGGAIGWHLVTRAAHRPERTLRILVPAVLLLSFIPDLILGAVLGGAAGWIAAGTLMVMHVATLTIGVAVYSWLLPFRAPATATASASVEA